MLFGGGFHRHRPVGHSSSLATCVVTGDKGDNTRIATKVNNLVPNFSQLSRGPLVFQGFRAPNSSEFLPEPASRHPLPRDAPGPLLCFPLPLPRSTS